MRSLGANQVLRNTVECATFPGKSVTMIYGSVLLALRGGVNFPGKQRDITIEWPLMLMVVLSQKIY